MINVYAPLVWTKHGEAQLPSYVDVRNGVLTIQNARIEDSGRYICTSASAHPSRPGESVNEIVDVSINQNGGYLQPPTVKPLNELYTVLQGSDFTLTCEAAGNPYPTISWSKIHEQSLGTNVQQVGNILKIFNAQPHNRGIYQCSVSSNGQTTETSGVIDIEREYFKVLNRIHQINRKKRKYLPMFNSCNSIRMSIAKDFKKGIGKLLQFKTNISFLLKNFQDI